MVTALSAFILVSLIYVETGSADHGIGVPINRYAPKNQDEAAIVKLIQTVAQGWERRDVDQIMSAYAPDAVQRAWDNPNVMVNYEGIRAEALGAFRDPKMGQARFEDWIHRIYIVNTSAIVEINQKFHGWSRDHYYRDFWMFARRGGRWQLIRYDYEPQPPFLDR
ncbi:MAG TPA: nuclear transport factor 2 family protein [Candidatus Binatia bacterium]|jgi:ketosteroid isomerase-like protein|nr:nuclear transport factor 2 family protein [Candidatus Binatia bacterium]